MRLNIESKDALKLIARQIITCEKDNLTYSIIFSYINKDGEVKVINTHNIKYLSDHELLHFFVNMDKGYNENRLHVLDDLCEMRKKAGVE